MHRTVENARTTYRLIRDAYHSLNRKNFQESIFVLEKVLASGVGDIYVLILLAVAYLCTDQFGKLARFITKMKGLNPGYLPLVQLDAFLRLKTFAAREEALKMYVDLEARYPADPHLHRAKRLVRDTPDFAGLQKSGRLQDFVHIPRPPRSLGKARKTMYVGTLGKKRIRIYRERRWILRALVTVVAACAVGLAGYGIWRLAVAGWFTEIISRARGRAGKGRVDMVTVSGTDYDLVRTVKPGSVPVYYQSAREMTADFNRARVLIKEEEYNRALYILNGMYHSNVNFVVREKVDFLIHFVMDQEDREFQEVPYRDVSGSTYRYLGYAVRWKGKILAVKDRGDSQVMVMEVEEGGDKPAVDLYSRRPVPGLAKDARVTVEGVISGFIGKEKRVYITAHSVSAITKH